jgi:hypothetical protein
MRIDRESDPTQDKERRKGIVASWKVKKTDENHIFLLLCVYIEGNKLSYSITSRSLFPFIVGLRIASVRRLRCPQDKKVTSMCCSSAHPARNMAASCAAFEQIIKKKKFT